MVTAYSRSPSRENFDIFRNLLRKPNRNWHEQFVTNCICWNTVYVSLLSLSQIPGQNTSESTFDSLMRINMRNGNLLSSITVVSQNSDSESIWLFTNCHFRLTFEGFPRLTRLTKLLHIQLKSNRLEKIPKLPANLETLSVQENNFHGIFQSSQIKRLKNLRKSFIWI